MSFSVCPAVLVRGVDGVGLESESEMHFLNKVCVATAEDADWHDAHLIKGGELSMLLFYMEWTDMWLDRLRNR